MTAIHKTDILLRTHLCPGRADPDRCQTNVHDRCALLGSACLTQNLDSHELEAIVRATPLVLQLQRILKNIVDKQRSDPYSSFDPRAALFVCNRWDQVPDVEREIGRAHV